ncbi:hypothetical protein AB0C68_27990 [Streptomyces tendae]|uniref:hypothetical protein n=1 Tax=Streptomyces tendae TaxID=1932 RepID=UPI0033C0FEAF
MERIHTEFASAHAVGVLHLAGVGLARAAPVPLGLFQVRAGDDGVEPARQGPLFAAAAAFQEMQRRAFEAEEVVGEACSFAGVAVAAQRAFSELPVRHEGAR